MGRLADLVVGIKGDTKQFDNAIRKSEKTLLAFGKSATKIGKSLTMFVTLPLLGIGAAFAKVAADAEETNSKFNAVFKNQASVVRIWAREYSQATGRSTIKNIEWLASVQDLFVPLGVARNKAVDLSKSVVTLATDISSFNNQPTERVLLDIQSALVGSVITMRKYGVVLTETIVDQELLNMGVEGGGRAATAAEKALARLNIIIASTKDAQGDAVRTADSFTNRMIALQSSVIDLSEGFGNVMVPTLQKLVTVIINAVRFVDNLNVADKKLIITIAGLAAAIGPLLFVVGKMVTLFGILAGPGGLLAALGGPAGVVVLAAFAIIALTAAIVRLNAASIEEKKLDLEIIALKDALTRARKDERVAILETITAKQREKIVAVEVRKAEIESRIASLVAVLGQTDAEAAHRVEMGRVNDELKEAKANFLAVNEVLIEAIEKQREERQARILLLPVIEEQTEKRKKSKEEIEKERKAQEKLNEQIKKSEEGFWDWVAAQEEVVAFTQTLTRVQIGLNTPMAIFLDTMDAAVGTSAEWVEEIVSLNIALEEQLSLFEINAIVAAESYRVQVEAAEEAERAEEKLIKVKKRLGRVAIQTAVDISNALSQIWGNYYSGLLANEELTDEERKQIQYDAAVASKKFSLFEAGIGAAQAIISGFTTKPFWPVGLAMGALASTLAAVQIAAIATTPIPALAEGGIVTQPTLALIGEKGPERITPLDEEPIHITVNVAGKLFYDEMTRGIRDRKILVDGRSIV